MFGNKYAGDTLAKEFYKLMELKKVAEEGGEENPALDPQNHVEDPTLDPAEFLQTLDEGPDIAGGVDEKINNLDSWSDDAPQVEEQDDCGDMPMYSDDMNYLLDQRASDVLEGLGKIAGSLKQRGEVFAADIVKATAISIKSDLVKEASQKLETITVLTKIASEISKDGDTFTADIVEATIQKIKSQE